MIPVMVAVVAAVASVTGAIVGLVAARSARRSSDSIDRRRHAIEALDHDAQGFNTAFAAFIAQCAAVNQGGGGDPGPALFTAEILLVHHRTTPELAAAVGGMLDHFVQWRVNRVPGAGFDERIGKVRAEMRRINLEMERERSTLVVALAE